MSRVIVVTGSDSGFFELMMETLRSIERVRPEIDEEFDVGVLDCGLSEAQRKQLAGGMIKRAEPAWPDFVPAQLRLPKHAARFTRTRLPEMFPGYAIYLWIDADAWVQDGRFFSEYVRRAESGALAIVHEAEAAYRLQWRVVKWNLGNLLLSFGLLRGLYLWRQKPINNGLFALRADAPHWKAWERYYEEAVRRSGKFYSQIPMTAAIHLDRLPISYLKGEFNWITSRGQPAYDVATNRFCLPYPGHAPLSVIHMAGAEKDGTTLVATSDGSTRKMSFRFRDWSGMSVQAC